MYKTQPVLFFRSRGNNMRQRDEAVSGFYYSVNINKNSIIIAELDSTLGLH